MKSHIIQLCLGALFIVASIMSLVCFEKQTLVEDQKGNMLKMFMLMNGTTQFVLGVVIVSSKFKSETFRNLGISTSLPLALIFYSWWTEVIGTNVTIAKSIAAVGILTACLFGFVAAKKEDAIEKEAKISKVE